MIRKFQYGRQNPIWPPKCQKICSSRYLVDIKSEEIFQIVSFQNHKYKQNYLYDKKNQYGCPNPIWPPSCQKICLTGSDINIESKEIYLKVVFQCQGIQFQ